MMNTSDIKTGKHIVWEGQAYTVLYHEHSKTGRAGAVLRTKLKNLFTGNVLDKTFQGSEKVEEAEVTKSKAQYLYREAMTSSSFPRRRSAMAKITSSRERK